MKEVEQRGEPARLRDVREVAGAFEDLELAAGHRGVRLATVRGGDDAVAGSPDDQRRHRLGQVEPVAGGDPLPGGIEDGAHRVDEGAAGLAVGERRVAAGDLGAIGADPDADGAEPAADRAPDLDQRVVRDQRQDELRAGQGRGAQRDADLLAEAAAVDEHESLDPLGKLVGELHRDAAAERVADDGRAEVTEGAQQVADARGEGTKRVVAARLCRETVAEQVGRDDREVLGKLRQDLVPGVHVAGDAVDEDQHRALAPPRGR